MSFIKKLQLWWDPLKLHTAIMNKESFENIQEWIHLGANLNRKNAYDWTALLCAIYHISSPEVVIALLMNGAEADIKDPNGWTALMLSLDYKYNPHQIAIIMVLIHKSNLNIQDDLGWTPLHKALNCCAPLEIIIALLELGHWT